MWKIAGLNIKYNQESYKEYYDRKAKPHNLKIGDKLLVYTPEIIPGTNTKLRRQGRGPYEVLEVTLTNVRLRVLSNPMKKPIFVHVNR